MMKTENIFGYTGCPQSLDTWEITLTVNQTDLLQVHLNFTKRTHLCIVLILVRFA